LIVCAHSLPDPDVSISRTIRQQPIPETNGTLPGCAENTELSSDSQGLSPDVDSPSGLNGLDDGNLAKTSENSAPHSSQAVIAVYDDKISTPQLLSEAHNLGSSVKPPPRNKAYAEVDGAALSQGVFQEYCTVLGSSRVVGDERSPTVQDRSSNHSYETSSSEKYITKKIDGRVVIPDVIDLTVSQGQETQRRPTTSAEQHCIIGVDKDERITKDLASGSQDAPIDLSSSPQERRPAKVLHPFFAQQVTKEHKGKSTNISRLITPISSHMQVPWPNAEDQHNLGPQTSFPSGSSVFGIYHRTPARVRSPSTSGLRWLNVEDPQPLASDTHGIGVESPAPTPLEHETVVSSLPSAHREHPGISRCLNEPHGRRAPRVVEDGEMWTQRWKPRCAADVLGNEDNALYLKSWLQALALRSRDMSQSGAAGEKDKTAEEDNIRGTKRHTVVRAVVKKRRHKRRRIDSDDESSIGEWIIDDDKAVERESGSDNEPVDWASSRTMAGTSPSLFRRERYPDVIEDHPLTSAAHDGPHFPEFSTLTNTILLAGPPGSGKSSTVHACAEELGWEVFEVHPGIGKRSGGSISSLIGDVGKNHHVGRRGDSSINNMQRGSSLVGLGSN
jgi:ATPase family associated with various cellular activities (AAA)